MDAGFHQIPSLPGLAATIACPIPTACAPVGSSRNSDPSLPVGVWPAAGCARATATATLERSRLIDQHDGDVVPHRVAQPTLVTDERLLRFTVLELALALGTNQNLEKPRRQAHLLFPVAS